MAARTRKIRHDGETRAKIQATLIIGRFQDCVEGKIELSAAQVSCGKVLLDKSLPNLQSTDNTNTHEVGDTLAQIIMSRVNGKTRTK